MARQVYALTGLSSQERQERLDALQRQNPALHDRVADRLTDALRLRQVLEQLSADSTKGSELTGVSDELIRIEGYFCLEMISLGGQGDVYLANQISTGQLVAIKVLRPAENKTKLSLRRFEREVDALAMLSHSGIVQIIDRGMTDDEQPYVVTKFIEGLHLDEYVEGWREEHVDQSPLAESVLQIWFQVAEGVAAIHQADLVHRDIKPSNIIVSDDGRPHILDFGLAKNLLPDNITSLDVTTRATFIGTPKWASPEQATLGGQNVDARSDVYSLGLLLYYMISGRMPYDVSDNMQQILAAIATQEPLPLRQACATSRNRASAIADCLRVWKAGRPRRPSHDLERVLRTALTKNPDQRYQSVEDLVTDVNQCLASKRPLHAQAGGWQFRSVASWLLLAAICVGVIGFVGLMTRSTEVAKQKSVDSETSAVTMSKKVNISAKPSTPDLSDNSVRPEKKYLKKMAGAHYFRGHSYLLLQGFWTWDEANQYAQLVGGHLFVPDDHRNELGFLSSQIHHVGIRGRTRPQYWIGVKHSKSTGTVTWDNKPLVFTGWRRSIDLDKDEMQYGFGISLRYSLTPEKDATMSMLIEWPFVPAREDIGNGLPPEDAVIHGDYAYKLFTDPQGWVPAIEECYSQGGCLVDIQSKEEEAFLVELLRENDLIDRGAWIGAAYSKGKIDLVTGHPTTYSNLSSTLDTTDVLRTFWLYLSADGWKAWMGDNASSYYRPYICKWVLKK